jgi:long-chain acyl-CoA synthetase
MAERHDLAVALQEMTDEGLTRTSFRDVRAASIRVASRLMGLGVKRGDRVLLAGHNRPGWPLAYFGILRAGGVAVPFDPGLEGPQLANIIRSSGARLAIWGSEVDDKGGAAARSLCPDLWVLDLAEVTALPENPSEAAFTPEQEAAAEGVRPGHRDIASVIYTSGTTGEPKGVMLSHENFTSLLASLAALFPLTENDRVLSVLPLHHTFEFACGLLLPLSPRLPHPVPRRGLARAPHRRPREGAHHRDGGRARAVAAARAAHPGACGRGWPDGRKKPSIWAWS